MKLIEIINLLIKNLYLLIQIQNFFWYKIKFLLINSNKNKKKLKVLNKKNIKWLLFSNQTEFSEKRILQK